MFNSGKTFLKESFSPNPFQRTLHGGFYFFVIMIAFNRRATNVRTELERLLLEERLPTEEGGEV